MNALLVIPLVLLLDRIFGEPARFHPLVGYGKVANWLERKLNKGKNRFNKGMLAWLIAVIPLTLLVNIIDNALGGLWLSLLFGWLAIGWQSLREHGLAVVQALTTGDLIKARTKTSYLVSRDTRDLDEGALSKATTESILENGSDAIFAALFWLAILGAPGVVFYRLCNTLDAMWGYRNEQFEQFGKVSAIIDDGLNFIPARLTALLYVIFGDSRMAWQAWHTQAKTWYSPNAGVVMASGAGALSISLGGNAIYHGKEKQRPTLGNNGNKQKLGANTIKRAIGLLDKSTYAIITVCILFLLVGSTAKSLINT